MIEIRDKLCDICLVVGNGSVNDRREVEQSRKKQALMHSQKVRSLAPERKDLAETLRSNSERR